MAMERVLVVAECLWWSSACSGLEYDNSNPRCFAPRLAPRLAQFDSSEQPVSPKTWGSIADAERELDQHFEKKKKGFGFFGGLPAAALPPMAEATRAAAVSA